MAETKTVGASEFTRNFPEYQHQAYRSGMVVVTSHRRVIGAFISPDELEGYERWKAQERRVVKVGELDDELLADIRNAEYGVPPE